MSRTQEKIIPLDPQKAVNYYVFLNLIGNALDALTGVEKKTLQIIARKDEEFFRIEISDNGSGIPVKDLTTIFDPFFTTKPIGKGTGLGLSVSRSIIEGHGGSIQCQSEPGEMTTFTVSLPVRSALLCG